MYNISMLRCYVNKSIMKNLRVQKRIEWRVQKRRNTTQLNTIVYIFLEKSRGKGLRSDND